MVERAELSVRAEITAAGDDDFRFLAFEQSRETVFRKSEGQAGADDLIDPRLQRGRNG